VGNGWKPQEDKQNFAHLASTNFYDSFLYTSQLQCKKVICAKRFTKEVTLGTENDVESKTYAVRASKH